MTPRWLWSTPARRRPAKICSRKCSGIPRASATSRIGTGPAPPRCASSVRASTAERLFSVIVISGTPEKPATDREFSRRYPVTRLSRRRGAGCRSPRGVRRARRCGPSWRGRRYTRCRVSIQPSRSRDHDLVGAVGRVEDHPRPAAAPGHRARGEREALDLPDVVEDDLTALGAQGRVEDGGHEDQAVLGARRAPRGGRASRSGGRPPTAAGSPRPGAACRRAARGAGCGCPWWFRFPSSVALLNRDRERRECSPGAGGVAPSEVGVRVNRRSGSRPHWGFVGQLRRLAR